MNAVLAHAHGLLLIEWWSLLSEVGKVWAWGQRTPASHSPEKYTHTYTYTRSSRKRVQPQKTT